MHFRSASAERVQSLGWRKAACITSAAISIQTMKTSLFSSRSVTRLWLALVVSLGTAHADIVLSSTFADIGSLARASNAPEPVPSLTETGWMRYERKSEDTVKVGVLSGKVLTEQNTTVTASANSLTCTSSGFAELKATPAGDRSPSVKCLGRTRFRVAFTVNGTSTFSLSASASAQGGVNGGDDDGDENYVEIRFIRVDVNPDVDLVRREVNNDPGVPGSMSVSESGELLPGQYEFQCEANSLNFPLNPTSQVKFSVTLKVTSVPVEPDLFSRGEFHWIRRGTSAFSVPRNWRPEGVPAIDAESADAAFFDLRASYGVSLGGVSRAVDLIRLKSGGTMTLSNGTLFATSTALDAPSFIATGNARLILPPGGGLATVGAIVGNDAGSSGEVRVLGSGASWQSSGLTVGGPLTEILTIGGAGTGRLTVSGGGDILTDDAIVGGGSAPGFATITGDGSRWDTRKLSVGFPSEGRLSILDGGVVSSAGRVEIGSGANNAGLSSVRVQGIARSGSPSHLFVNGGGLFVGNDVPASLKILDGGLVDVLDGPNPADGFLSIDNFGEVRVRGVRATGSLRATLDVKDVNIQGEGFLLVEAGGLVRCSGSVFVGGATGRGDVTVEGLSPTGFASELEITSVGRLVILGGANTDGVLNILNSGTASIVCSEMQIGSLAGHGTVIVNSNNPAQPESFLSITGTLKIPNPAGSVTGELRIIDSTVEVLGDVFVGANGAIFGRGVLSVSGTLHNSGTISPGLSPGVLKIEGNFEQDATGVVVAEVGGATPGTQHDQFIVTGTSTIGGKLILQFINGYAPKAGDHFNVLNMTGATTGAFAAIEVAGLEPGAQFQTASSGGVFTATAMNDTTALQTVSIRAVTKKAFEKRRRAAAILVSRKGTKASKANPLTVNYAIDGTAENGIDYTLLTGSATIPAGKSAVVLKLTPFDDRSPEVAETVELEIIPGADYSNSLRSKTRVTIVNNKSPQR